MGFLAGKFALAIEMAQILNECREIDRRRAAVVAQAAGEAGPDILLDAGRMEATGKDRGGNGPRRKGLADQGQGAGGGAFAAVLAGMDIVGGNQLLQLFFSGGRDGCWHDRGRLNAGRTESADIDTEPLEKLEQFLRLFRKKGGKTQPCAAQPHDIEDLAHVFGVACGGGGAAAVAAGSGFAADQGDAVGPFGKGLEQKSSVNAAGAGGAHHVDFVRDWLPLVLEGLEGGMGSPVTEEEENLLIAVVMDLFIHRYCLW